MAPGGFRLDKRLESSEWDFGSIGCLAEPRALDVFIWGMAEGFPG
jgi:hypothetical protein